MLKAAKGPQVVVSRTDPALLIKLFEMEVPEIYDGTVQIRGCVREAGERAKVAVISREKDVDPVGACVGMKGTRVQSIIRELRGEKIDIVEWSDDAIQFVEKALSPAKISRVTIVDEEQRIMEVVVEDKQLSLAIGKKGQNVRLAAKLVGWRIDIKSEEEKRQEVEAEMARMARMVDELRSLPHVGEKTIQKLIDAGVQGLSHILEMTDERSARSRASARRPPRRSARPPTRPRRSGTSATPRRPPATPPSRPQPSAAAAAEQAQRSRAEQAAADQAAERRPPADEAATQEAEPAAETVPAVAGSDGQEERRMTNVRVFQLARDLGIPSQEVIDRLKKLGLEVKTASSSIDEDTADKLKRALKIDAAHRARSGGSTAAKRTRPSASSRNAHAGREDRRRARGARARRRRRRSCRRGAQGRQGQEARGAGHKAEKDAAKRRAAEEPPPALIHAPGAPRLGPKVTAPPPRRRWSRGDEPEADEPADEAARRRPAPPAPPAAPVHAARRAPVRRQRPPARRTHAATRLTRPGSADRAARAAGSAARAAVAASAAPRPRQRAPLAGAADRRRSPRSDCLARCARSRRRGPWARTRPARTRSGGAGPRCRARRIRSAPARPGMRARPRVRPVPPIPGRPSADGARCRRARPRPQRASRTASRASRPRSSSSARSTPGRPGRSRSPKASRSRSSARRWPTSRAATS